MFTPSFETKVTRESHLRFYWVSYYQGVSFGASKLVVRRINFYPTKDTERHKNYLNERWIFVVDNFVDENVKVKSLRLRFEFLGCFSAYIIFYEFDIPQRIKFFDWY